MLRFNDIPRCQGRSQCSLTSHQWSRDMHINALHVLLSIPRTELLMLNPESVIILVYAYLYLHATITSTFWGAQELLRDPESWDGSILLHAAQQCSLEAASSPFSCCHQASSCILLQDPGTIVSRLLEYHHCLFTGRTQASAHSAGQCSLCEPVKSPDRFPSQRQR